MIPRESGILEKSEIYFYSPSPLAKKRYYYPLCAGHYYYDAQYYLSRQTYGSLLILHVIDGAFTYRKHGISVTAQKGETVVLDCYRAHEYYTDSGCECVWVHVCGLNTFSLFEELTHNGGSCLCCKNPQYIERLLFSVLEGLGSGMPPTEIFLSLKLYELFAELLNPQNAGGKLVESENADVSVIQNYIIAHLHEDLNVRQLASQLYMSPSQFSRVFKRRTGVSPYQYILIARLNRAKDLLQKTDLSISSIAYDVGFHSESNFIYSFTKNVGVSPRKFRKLKF